MREEYITHRYRDEYIINDTVTPVAVCSVCSEPLVRIIDNMFIRCNCSFQFGGP